MDSQPRGAFVLDVDDPYVYALYKEEFKHYPNCDIIEPQQIRKDAEALPVPPQEPLLMVPNSTITYDVNEQMYNNNNKTQHTMYMCEYEKVDWDCIDYNPLFASTQWFTNRKGLSRKAELVKTIENHVASKCKCAQKEKNEFGKFDEVLDDENWYYFSDIDDSDSDVDENSSEDEDSDEDAGDTPSDEAVEDQAGANDDDLTTHVPAQDESDEDNDDSEGDDDSEEEGPSKEFLAPVFKSHQNCCPLQQHAPESIYFTLYNLNELDELLISELPEINYLDDDEAVNWNAGNVWILKPSMTNQANGIFVIASRQQFVDVFTNPSYTAQQAQDMLSIRDWVIQRYVHPPLLLNGNKFHLRTHVVAAGGLNVYVVDRILALFSLKKYTTTTATDSSVHITNVCHQKDNFDENGREFDEKECVSLLHEALQDWALQYVHIMYALLMERAAAGGKYQTVVDKYCEVTRQYEEYMQHKDQQQTIVAATEKEEEGGDDEEEDNVISRKQKYNQKLLSHLLRVLSDEFTPLVKPTKVDDDDNEEEEEEKAQILPKHYPQHFVDNFNLFLFFMKRVIKQYTLHPMSQMNVNDETRIDTIFNKKQQGATTLINVEELAKHVALHFYSHVLHQIQTILQELFIACLDYGHVNPQLQCTPPLDHITHAEGKEVLNYHQFNALVDDRLSGEELEERNVYYNRLVAGPAHAPEQLLPRDVQSMKRGMMMNQRYKPLNNAIELYGFDFMIDHRCKVYLIEANPGPNFANTGERLKYIVCQPMVKGMVSVLMQQKLHLLQQHVAQQTPEELADVALQEKYRQVVEHYRDVVMVRDEPVQLQYHVIKSEEEQDHTKAKNPHLKFKSQPHLFTDHLGYAGATTWNIPQAPHFIPVFHIPSE